MCEILRTFGAHLFSNFETYNAGGSVSSGLRPIFADSGRQNPLQSFAYNSADYKAEAILEKLRSRDIERDRCEALLKAEFGEQLPQPIAVDRNTVKPNSQLDRILQITSRMRESYAPYIKNVGPKAGASTFVADMKRFKTCVSYNEEISECAAIGKVLKIAEKGTSSGGKQTIRDQNFLKATNTLKSDWNAIEAPTLIPQYTEGKITLSNLFQNLSKLWADYDNFQQETRSYAKHYYEDKGGLPPELESALNEISKSFQHAMMTAQIQFFPLLRKGALEVRLARIEEVAKILALEDIKIFDPKEKLDQLADDLVCLTAYPVGPAFDAKYAKELKSH